MPTSWQDRRFCILVGQTFLSVFRRRTRRRNGWTKNRVEEYLRAKQTRMSAPPLTRDASEHLGMTALVISLGTIKPDK